MKTTLFESSEYILGRKSRWPGLIKQPKEVPFSYSSQPLGFVHIGGQLLAISSS
jgi:hypothetical protein